MMTMTSKQLQEEIERAAIAHEEAIFEGDILFTTRKDTFKAGANQAIALMQEREGKLVSKIKQVMADIEYELHHDDDESQALSTLAEALRELGVTDDANND
jgi:DNA-binding transcriptional regulator GbsR (MarR family)